MCTVANFACDDGGATHLHLFGEETSEIGNQEGYNTGWGADSRRLGNGELTPLARQEHSAM